MTTYNGKTYEKVPGCCGHCAGYTNRDLCSELPDCQTIIGPKGEPVQAMWREVEL